MAKQTIYLNEGKALRAADEVEIVRFPGATRERVQLDELVSDGLPDNIAATKIADGSVSNAEFQHLDGVTSGIQAQIDAKLGVTATFNEQAGTTYMVQGTDNGAVITTTSGSPVTITLPEQGTEVLPEGFTCTIIQRGAGQVTIAKEGTDVIESKGGALSLTGQHSTATVSLLAAGAPNTYGLYGDLA